MPKPATPLSRIVELCERFYARDGFVRWSDVAKALGVARQTVQIRLKAAVERGELSPEDVERWQSMTSRAAEYAARAEERDRAKKAHRLNIQLTPENHAWLLEEAAFRKAKTVDIINGLITRARSVSPTTENDKPAVT